MIVLWGCSGIGLAGTLHGLNGLWFSPSGSLRSKRIRFFKGPDGSSSLLTFLGSAHFLLFLFLREIGVTFTSTLSSLASVGE